MKTVMNKEKVITFAKKAFTYAIIVGALVIGFFIGKRFPQPHLNQQDKDRKSTRLNSSHT